MVVLGGCDISLFGFAAEYMTTVLCTKLYFIDASTIV